MLEPLQGEGGIKPGTREYFALARKIADDNGAILIATRCRWGWDDPVASGGTSSSP
jgi:acetylornithine aminotransferase